MSFPDSSTYLGSLPRSQKKYKDSNTSLPRVRTFSTGVGGWKKENINYLEKETPDVQSTASSQFFRSTLSAPLADTEFSTQMALCLSNLGFIKK